MFPVLASTLLQFQYYVIEYKFTPRSVVGQPSYLYNMNYHTQQDGFCIAKGTFCTVSNATAIWLYVYSSLIIGANTWLFALSLYYT